MTRKKDKWGHAVTWNKPKVPRWRKPVDDLLDQATNICSEKIVKDARALMRKHPNLDEFVMGMGTWFFADTTREEYGQECVDDQDLKYLEDFAQIFYEYDSILHLTGSPMRFSADSPIITDW